MKKIRCNAKNLQNLLNCRMDFFLRIKKTVFQYFKIIIKNNSGYKNKDVNFDIIANDTEMERKKRANKDLLLKYKYKV